MLENKEEGFSSWLWLFIPGIILVVYGFVMGLTYHDLWPVNYDNTSKMGDTYGGLLGPIMNLVGAVLVYLSFKQQQIANRIQTKALKEESHRTNAINRFDQLVNMIDNIETEFNKLEVDVDVVNKIFKASKALNVISDHYKNPRADYHHSLKNEPKAAMSYWNFCILISYVADGIMDYKYDLNSQFILKIKFINVVTRFEEHLELIQSNTKDGEEVVEVAVNEISQEVLKKISIVRVLKLEGFLFW